MKQINDLPVLTALTKKIKKSIYVDLSNTVFVCVQHLLYTTVNLFQSLIELGAKPSNIFLIGKNYSTCPEVEKIITELGIQLISHTSLTILGEYNLVFSRDVKNMWQIVTERINEMHDKVSQIVVLDDGGRCLENIPDELLQKNKLIGIEQTTAGLQNPLVQQLTIPIVDVATCAVKLQLESNMIIDAIFKKIEGRFKLDNLLKYGIIGAGAIGIALYKKLSSKNLNVYLHDIDKAKALDSGINKAYYIDNIQDTINYCDVILGCTGKDITRTLDLTKILPKHKTFISCSSEDKEFLSLLKYINPFHNIRKNSQNDIIYETQKGATIEILNSGFPANFDASGESVPAENIQLTRALLLGGVIQAILLNVYSCDKYKGRTMLHEALQAYIANEWFKAIKFVSDKSLIFRLKNKEYIRTHSGGNPINFEKLDFFSQMTK